MHAEILSYSRSRGLFAGIDLGGATLRPDNKGNEALVGHPVSQRAMLTGEVPRPSETRALYEQLDRYAGTGADRAQR
jgi:lipid-binding SYLF domain-containing protein